MTEYPVVFHAGGQHVVGMWHPPLGVEEAAPALVMCHGFSGNRSEGHRLFVEAARDFARRGIGVLRFDFRGAGDSEGDFVDVTVSGEVADTRAALAFVRERAMVDPSRLALLGFSLGGTVAALAVAEEPEVRAVVLWNAVAFPGRMAERRRTESTDAQFARGDFVDQHGLAVGLPFIQELPLLKPLSTLASADVPVLLVCSGNDEVVLADEGEAYVEALKAAGRSVEKHVVADAGHSFQSVPHKGEAIRVTGAWLARHLK